MPLPTPPEGPAGSGTPEEVPAAHSDDAFSDSAWGMPLDQNRLPADNLRLLELARASADNSGTWTAVFDPVPLGTAWWGTISVPGLSPSQTAKILVGNKQIGVIPGSSPWGPIVALGGERVTLTATGLSSNTVYEGVWVGIIRDNLDVRDLVAPLPIAVPLAGGGGTVVFSGDLSGTDAGPQTVVGIQGEPVSATAPTNGQVLEWNGSLWLPTTPSAGGVTSVTAADSSLTISPTTGAVVASRAALTGDVTAGAGSNATTLAAIDGTAVSASSPTSGYVFGFNGTAWVPVPVVLSFNTRTGAVVLTAADVESTFTAKGQLFLGTGSGTGGLLAIGSTGQIPVVTGGTIVWTTLATGVSSVFGRTGAVVATSGDYTVAQVTGAAPLASPTFTGTPAAPTAAPGTNTTQLATTAFVQAATGLYLPLAGGTMSGAIAMGANKITGLANGSAAQDAAAFGQIPTSAATIGGLLIANNLSDVADAGSSRFNLSEATLSAVAAVAVANVNIASPGATLDGYTILTGDEILLTAQSTPSQNGVWTWNGASSALTRPNEFPHAGVVKRGRIVAVINGTLWLNTLWLLDSTAAGITIDTTAQTWVPGNAVIGGVPTSITSPASNQVLVYSLGQWINETVIIDFNGRTGHVLPGNFDYQAVAAPGLTGAISNGRLAGGTASGAPVSGSFLTGDFVVDQTGLFWICTAGGSPGTWVAAFQAATTVTGPDAFGASQVLGSSVKYARQDHDHGLPPVLNAVTHNATATVAAGEGSIFTGSTASQTLTLPTAPTQGTVNSLTNTASVSVTLARGGSTDVIQHYLTGSLTSIVIPPGMSIQVAYDSSTTTWYVIEGGFTPGTLLATTVYAPASLATYTVATSITHLDTTNLTVAFIVPPSGIADIEVAMDGAVVVTAAANTSLWLALLAHGTTTPILGDQALAVYQQAASGLSGSLQHYTAKFHLTGLTPGALTIDLAAGYVTGTGASANLYSMGVTGTTVATGKVGPTVIQAKASI